jgi:hypothetical protein
MPDSDQHEGRSVIFDTFYVVTAFSRHIQYYIVNPVERSRLFRMLYRLERVFSNCARITEISRGIVFQ